MKTNSPNPVDSDLQLLIADCKNEIETIEQELITYPNHPALLSDLQRQKMALAALTAEPVYQFIVNNPDKDGYIEWADCNPDYFSKETPDKRRMLYTTSPAQLLRPVELPDCVDDLHGVGPVMSADAVIEALRKQGYEVKS